MSTEPKPLLEGLTPQQIQEAAERWLAMENNPLTISGNITSLADTLRAQYPPSPSAVDYKASFHAVLSEMSRRQLSCVDRKNEGDSAIYFLLQTLGVKFRSKEYGYEMGPLTRSISVEEIKRDFQDIAPKGSDQINGAQTTIINAASIRIKPQDAELGPL